MTKMALAVLAFLFVVALLDGPLKSSVPSCKSDTFGFCVQR
jgi:hypothetical protein